MLPHPLVVLSKVPVASHSRLDLHVRSVIFLSHSHEHSSFTDFNRPSILSYVDLWELFLVLTKRECVYIICHRMISGRGARNIDFTWFTVQHTTPLYFIRCCFLSNWTFLVCL